MSTNSYAGQSANLGSPPEHFALVTPSDTADLAYVTQALQVGGSGTLKVTTLGGETLVLPATIVSGNGGYIIGRFTKVWAASTTATDILAVW